MRSKCRTIVLAFGFDARLDYILISILNEEIFC